MAWPGVLKVAFVLTLVGLFFDIAGYVLPWWFVVSDKVFIGLHFALYCENGIGNGTCSVYGYNTLGSISDNTARDLDGNIFLLIIIVAASISVGFCLLSAIILIICACADARSKCPYVLSCILQFFSAFIAALLVGLFSWLYIGLAGILNVTGTNFPYSILSFGLGSLIIFIAFVCLAIATCTWRYEDNSGDTYPMANVNKPHQMHTGYDNPRYPSEKKYGYNDPPHQSYGSDYRQSSSRNGYSNQEYPYKNDNMYRPYKNTNRY